MYPVLVVEGVAHKVEGIDYLDGKPKRVIVEQNGRKMFYDDKSMSANPNALDLKDAIRYVGRYKQIYETLNKLIEDNQREMKVLAFEHIRNDKPFTPSEIKKKFDELELKTVGLSTAQDIVHEFMVEDVDLSGGEEDVNYHAFHYADVGDPDE